MLIMFRLRKAKTKQKVRKSNRIMLNRLKIKSAAKAPTEDEVKTYFQKFGTVVDISADAEKSTGFVEFLNAQEMEIVLEQPIHKILGCEIRVFASGRTTVQK